MSELNKDLQQLGGESDPYTTKKNHHFLPKVHQTNMQMAKNARHSRYKSRDGGVYENSLKVPTQKGDSLARNYDSSPKKMQRRMGNVSCPPERISFNEDDRDLGTLN